MILESEIGELILQMNNGMPILANRDRLPKYTRISYELLATSVTAYRFGYMGNGIVTILGTLWTIARFDRDTLVVEKGRMAQEGDEDDL